MEKLGLDIPPPPEVTLEEITAREIRIAWKQPEFHNSIHKHIIQLNGVKGSSRLEMIVSSFSGAANILSVGESKRAETAVEILNLVPGSIYHICVLSVSAANFQTPSAIIHVRTKSLPLSQSQQNAPVGNPTIRASIPRSTAGLAAPAAPVMAREHSGGQLQAKRSTAGRKPSPAASTTDIAHSSAEDLHKSTANDDHDETLEQLADRLKSLQQENETVEKQTADEEEEHIALIKELEKQRDELKKRVKEKDEASGDLKKHVYKLESVNRTVQSEKAKRERLLQQKESERKKRKADIIRWQEQVESMAREAAESREEKARVEEEAKQRADEIREKIGKEQSEMKVIDDEIQDKGGRVKKLEDERKTHQEADSEDGKELDRIDNERARQWDVKLSNLHARYATLVSLHAQVSLLEATILLPRTLTVSQGAATVSRGPGTLEMAHNTAKRQHRTLYSSSSRFGPLEYRNHPSPSASQFAYQQCLFAHELYVPRANILQQPWLQSSRYQLTYFWANLHFLQHHERNDSTEFD